MIIETLIALFNRDLNRLKSEIESYSTDDNLWVIDNGINNSGGNLCLHLIGNLNTFIGAQLGNTGYIRHRDLEFSLSDLPKGELLNRINETIIIVENTLKKLTKEDLEAEYPVLLFKEKTTTAYVLFHLTTHLTYHLGQINYHRRLLDKS